MQDQSIEVVKSPGLDITYYLHNILDFFVSHFPQIVAGGKTAISSSIGYIVGIAAVVSVVLFFGIIYVVERLKYIRKVESKTYDAKVDMGYQTVDDDTKIIIKKWENIVRHTESPNANDWRQAIIEADIMLGDLLTKMGYKGQTIGEQLKRVARGDFKTLDQAGEAHGVRNRIAHDGSSYHLNQNEARAVIHMYRQVFDEFFYI